MGTDYIRSVRRERLKQLVDEHEGKPSLLAARLKRSPSQVSQWLSGHRTITEDSARAIEERTRKPRGWLDEAASALLASPTPADQCQITDREAQQVAAIYADLSPTERRRFLHLLEAAKDEPVLGDDWRRLWGTNKSTEDVIDEAKLRTSDKKRRLG